VRAGDITAEDAREKRRVLQLEMQFHGAMDGAMRFVKGDAIAGLIIVFINLVGGMTIGMVQRGLSAGEAGQLYVLLSVGDGLIAQIPAMFIALAAGTIVTRVTTVADSNLGKDITRQLGADPKALGVSGTVSIAMGFIPGFPTVVFIVLGSILCGLAYMLVRAESDASAGVDDESRAGGAEGAHGGGPAAGAPTDADPDAAPMPRQPPGGEGEEPLPLRPAQPGDIMVINGNPETLELLRPDAAYMYVEQTKELFLRRMGFSAPPVGFRYDPSLQLGEFVVEIDDVPGHRFEIPDVDPTVPLTARQARDYADRIAAIRVRHAAALFGVPEAGQWLTDIQPTCGRLAVDIQQLMPFMVLVESLRRLLDDGVGLVPPRLVLEGLVKASQRSQDPDMAAEVVRGFLRRQISNHAADRDKTIHALVLGPDIEAALRQASSTEQGGSSIRANDEAVQRFVANAADAIGRNRDGGDELVMMVAADLRRPLRQLLVQSDMDIGVLSFADVAAGFQVRTVDVLTATAKAA
jgi:type III secretion protein V